MPLLLLLVRINPDPLDPISVEKIEISVCRQKGQFRHMGRSGNPEVVLFNRPPMLLAISIQLSVSLKDEFMIDAYLNDFIQQIMESLKFLFSPSPFMAQGIHLSHRYNGDGAKKDLLGELISSFLSMYLPNAFPRIRATRIFVSRR